jgi:serine palmitoyltransferase
MSNKIELPWYSQLFVYIVYILGILFGYIYEAIEFVKKLKQGHKANSKGYAPLFSDWEAFYTKHLYARINDCWNRPIASAPATWVDVVQREGDILKQCYKMKQSIRCLNLASYNYLGFAGNKVPHLKELIACATTHGVSTQSPAVELGTTTLHRELEELIAQFVGKEEALVFGMGFATNAGNIPALVGKGDLIVSDSLNHSSVVTGCRLSGAKIKTFKHNDPSDLERVLRESITEGQNKTHRSWRKILIIVEGIYSMEGEICKLAEIVKIKKKYKCYLYVDEAHSIGALGRTGRGICEYCDVDPKDVDILMGTFTKSFAAVGGYIASSKDVISHLRQYSLTGNFEVSLPPVCCQQVINVLKVLLRKDGTDLGVQRLKALRENSNFFRRSLIDRGFHVLGDVDSPIIPVALFHPGKMAAFSRECLKRNIAVVVVGFPAVPLLLSRVRFCISAEHKREDLEWALSELDELGEKLLLKYRRNKKLEASLQQ